MITRTFAALVAGAAVLAVLAGCSDASTAGPAAHGEHSGTHAMPDGTAMADEDMEHAGHGGDGLALWATQKAGGVVLVTDGEGHPFYRSDADRAGPACAGACAAEWQPVTVGAGETPELLGVQRSAVGAVRRTDGGMQLTLGGAPLYRHAGPAPVQPDVRQYASRGWHAVTPRGERVV